MGIAASIDRRLPRGSRESLRVALQGAIAGVATYLLCRGLGLPEISWGVISALFVIHQSADATFSAAAGRLVGTLIGTLVGIATVYLMGGEDLTVLRLAIAALAMNAIAVVRPEFRFGIVAATILALETDPEILGGALMRGAAVIIGTALGTVTALAIWP